MTETLAEKRCTPCRGGTPPLTHDEAQRLQAQAPNWELGDDAHRARFDSAISGNRSPLFRKSVSSPRPEAITPELSFGWGYATVSLSTKKIKGLHENDFIMASKINRVFDRSGRPLDRQ